MCEHANNIHKELKDDDLDTQHRMIEIICFSANVRQCNIFYSVVRVQLCI